MLTVEIPQYAAGVTSGAVGQPRKDHGCGPRNDCPDADYHAAGLLTDTLNARSPWGRKDEPQLVAVRRRARK